MNSNNILKTGVLDKALAVLNSKRQKNHNGKVHDEVRDYFIDNLHIIKEGLKFLEKELRVVGGDVDIVAKDDKNFYLIEVKTQLSRYNIRGNQNAIAQLLKQKKGLERMVSMFTNKKLHLKLIFIKYERDTKRIQVNFVNGHGKVERSVRFNLRVD
ncbi:MAG: YraN family protein [Candidatus Woesearchaeota archaeon]|jgi:Holliday junction resolvase-like predicted endonuclease|nr:YraN family protein [Candidatus Woesearchaeota archaeon]